MTNYDLEQKIMSCWQVVDDIQVLYHATDSIDINTVQNVCLGLFELYDLKFKALFEEYEKSLAKPIAWKKLDV